MPYVNPRGRLWPFFRLVAKWYTKNGKQPHTPCCATYGSPIPTLGYMGTYPIGGGFMPPFQITLHFGYRAHTTPGRTLRGGWSLVPLWPKRGLVILNVFTPKSVSPVPEGDGL